MKLTRTTLRKLILEAMISPSNLAQEIIDDPQVDQKIKTIIQTGLDRKDVETIRSGLALVADLYPEYADAVDAADPGTFLPGYDKKFKHHTDMNYIAEANRIVNEVLAPYLHLANFKVDNDDNWHRLNKNKQDGYTIEIEADGDNTAVWKQIQADFAAVGLKTKLIDWLDDDDDDAWWNQKWQQLVVYFGDSSPESRRLYGDIE